MGDSQLRNMGTIISNRKKYNSKKKSTTICYPGANTNFICDRIEELKSDKKSTDLTIHVGGNDIRNTKGNTFTPTEEILESYKRMIEAAKLKARSIIIVGIIPRRFESYEWQSRVRALHSLANF